MTCRTCALPAPGCSCCTVKRGRAAAHSVAGGARAAPARAVSRARAARARTASAAPRRYHGPGRGPDRNRSTPSPTRCVRAPAARGSREDARRPAQRRLRFLARRPRRLPPFLRNMGASPKSGGKSRGNSEVRNEGGGPLPGRGMRGALGGGFSSASFTRRRRPRCSTLSKRRMASAAVAASENSAKAKPRERPVTRSTPRRTRTRGSTSPSSVRSSSSVASKLRLPMKMVDEMGLLLRFRIWRDHSSLKGPVRASNVHESS